MPQLVVTTSVDDGILQFKLDGKIKLRNNDSQTIELIAGKEYIVQWFVRVTSGTSYSVKITSPTNATVDVKRTLTGSGKDYGGFKFIA